jgi:sigma-E factor negative regulatory protein RseB
MSRFARAAAVAFAVAGCAAPVAHADRAHDWLLRINDAARRLSYDGTFVYLHNGQLEALRIVHSNDGGRERVRLVSLNGAPREMVRDDSTVRCYFSDANSVVVEHRKADAKSFPAILPERLAALDDNYAIELGRAARIAGRNAQQLRIAPRDALRYGYYLWADTETGLLLKTDLLDADGTVVEQFMFTHLVLGDVAAAALEPESTGRETTWRREEGGITDTTAVPAWTVTDPPRGFRLTSHMTRTARSRSVPVEHLVYSDGLATVSVFVEKSEGGNAPSVRGTSKMGAVHAFGRRAGDYQVTVVGEVPQATVALIGNSVAARR